MELDEDRDSYFEQSFGSSSLSSSEADDKNDSHDRNEYQSADEEGNY